MEGGVEIMDEENLLGWSFTRDTTEEKDEEEQLSTTGEFRYPTEKMTQSQPLGDPQNQPK